MDDGCGDLDACKRAPQLGNWLTFFEACRVSGLSLRVTCVTMNDDLRQKVHIQAACKSNKQLRATIPHAYLDSRKVRSLSVTSVGRWVIPPTQDLRHSCRR